MPMLSAYSLRYCKATCTEKKFLERKSRRSKAWFMDWGHDARY